MRLYVLIVGPTKEHGPTTPNTADALREHQNDVPGDSIPQEVGAGGLHREISLSPAAGAASPPRPPPSAAAAVDSSSGTSGSNDPESEEVAVAAAGRTFRFSNSGSFPGLAAAAAVDSPSRNTAAASPFAQISLQKAVANTLLSSARQQQQQQSAMRSAATMPASVASFYTAASTSATAAAAVRMSGSSGPAALTGVTSRASRVSWATASTVLGEAMFDVVSYIKSTLIMNLSYLFWRQTYLRGCLYSSSAHCDYASHTNTFVCCLPFAIIMESQVHLVDNWLL